MPDNNNAGAKPPTLELPPQAAAAAQGLGKQLAHQGVTQAPANTPAQPTDGRARQEANTPGNLTPEAKENVEAVQKKPTMDAGATDGKLPQSRIDKALEQAKQTGHDSPSQTKTPSVER